MNPLRLAGLVNQHTVLPAQIKVNATGAASAVLAGDIAIGSDALADSGGDIAIGDQAAASGIGAGGTSIAIGRGADATGIGGSGLAIGEDATAGTGCTAIGHSSSASGINAVALGPAASATHDASTSLHRGSIHSNAVSRGSEFVAGGAGWMEGSVELSSSTTTAITTFDERQDGIMSIHGHVAAFNPTDSACAMWTFDAVARFNGGVCTLSYQAVTELYDQGADLNVTITTDGAQVSLNAVSAAGSDVVQFIANISLIVGGSIPN